jgi:hypothetical protein
MLAVLIERSKGLGFFDRLVPHLVEDGLSVLQYADDTILFLDDDLEKARGLRLVLSAFEKLYGLKINFHKSELFCFGDSKERVAEYVSLFGCKEGEFPFRYLGIPMSPSRIFKGIGGQLKRDFKRNLVVGRVNCYHQEGGLSLLNQSCLAYQCL